MHRLTELGLRDGGLMTIRHPHLVERYNRALTALVGRATALDAFRIDATGFSPEVAAEIGDLDYMNPLGVNRRYILLTLDQGSLPVVDQRFTSTRWLMRAFVEQNHEALFILTSKDAVYGELEDNTYKVNSVDDLLSIKNVIFTVNTPTGIAEKAVRLTKLCEEFKASETMWMQEGTVAEMAELAKAVGDVRRNPSIPRALAFKKGNFHSSHLGGLYVFHEGDRVTVVHEEKRFTAPETWQNKKVDVMSVDDAERVVAFLLGADLIHRPSPAYVLARRDALLRKLEFLVVDHISGLDPFADLTGLDFHETKNYIYKHHDELPRPFHEIARALKFCDAGLDWDAGDCAPATVAYMTAAKPGIDRDLVNHLLAHLTPADYMRAFQHNGPLFARRYEMWGDARRSYVADFLKRQLASKAMALVDTLFGNAEPRLAAADD